MVTGSALHDVDADAGMGVQEVSQEPSGMPARNGGNDADAQRSPRGAAHFGRDTRQATSFLHNGAAARKNPMAGMGGLRALALSLEQADTEDILESLHAAADDGRPCSNLFGGLPKAPVVEYQKRVFN